MLTGTQRATLYRLAMETGLRSGAIARLTTADFDRGDAPAVTVQPVANTKNRKLQVIPLRATLAHAMREQLRGKAPAAPAFDLSRKDETADLLRADLTAARRAWIGEGTTAEDRAKRAASDFLGERDAEGRVIDFHALRTTCGSWPDRAGVAASVATRITGHADPRTLQRHDQRSTLD